MSYEDIYNPDTSRYQGDFSSSLATAPPLSINPTTAYYGGYMDKGDLQASTSTLREVAGTLRNVLGQFTGAVFATFSTLRNLYASQTRPQEVRQPIVQPYISPEAGRYVGSATFLESAKGALTGRPTSPFMLKSDYQQLMSEDFAKRSTLLGGSVAGVATEIGAGWLGSKVLGPLISKGLFGSLAGGFAGYMGAGYLTSHVMGRINQGMEFDSLLKDTSSRLGINEGGALSRGFSSSTRRKIAKEFRGGDLKMGDYADIMEYGTEYGLFQGVTTPEQFTETVKSAAKQIKVLMRVLRETDVRDAIKDVATFRQWGVPQGQMVSFAMHADAVGRAMGLTSQGVMGHMAAGAQMGWRVGLSGAAGADISASGLLMAKAMLGSGAMSTEEMARVTQGGDINDLAHKMAWLLQKPAEHPIGMSLIAAMSKKAGKGYVIDEDIRDKVARGEIGEDELQRIAGGKMRRDPMLAYRIKNAPIELRKEMMPKEGEWYRATDKLVERYEAKLAKAIPNMPKEMREIIATDALYGSPEEGRLYRESRESMPQYEEEERQKESKARLDEAIEAARGKQGLSEKWQGLKDTAWGYTIGGFDKHISHPIVDSALGVKDRIARKSTDFYYQNWLGLHISDMPGAMPEGYAPPGQLSQEVEGRVEGVVSQTRARAAMAKTKEGEKGAASVIADKMKDEIEFFGSTEASRSWRLGGTDYAGLVKSPGEKLIDAGAYKHMDVYAAALTAVSQGTGQEEYMKKISEEYKSPEKVEVAKKLYEILKETLKNKTLAEKQMIEQLELMNRLYKEGQKTGVFQPGESYSTQQANYPVNTPSRESLGETRKRLRTYADTAQNVLIEPPKKALEWFNYGGREGIERGGEAADKYLVEPVKKGWNRYDEAVWEYMKAPLDEAWDRSREYIGTKSEEVSGSSSVGFFKKAWNKYDEAVGKYVRDPLGKYVAAPVKKGWEGFMEGPPKDVPSPHRGDRPDKKGLRKADHEGRMAKLREKSKSEISQDPHSGMRPDEAAPKYWSLYADDKDNPLLQHTNFDVWRSKWAAIGYDDVNHPIAKSKLTPDTMGHDFFSAGDHIDTKEDFARKGMVEVAKGKWVSASMAPHYGKGIPATTVQSPDINAPDASSGTVTPGAADASKALGASQGGLAQNAEKTSKSLEKVNKGLDGFLSRLNRSFLGATRNSNY